MRFVFSYRGDTEILQRGHCILQLKYLQNTIVFLVKIKTVTDKTMSDCNGWLLRIVSLAVGETESPQLPLPTIWTDTDCIGTRKTYGEETFNRSDEDLVITQRTVKSWVVPFGFTVTKTNGNKEVLPNLMYDYDWDTEGSITITRIDPVFTNQRELLVGICSRTLPDGVVPAYPKTGVFPELTDVYAPQTQRCDDIMEHYCLLNIQKAITSTSTTPIAIDPRCQCYRNQQILSATYPDYVVSPCCHTPNEEDASDPVVNCMKTPNAYKFQSMMDNCCSVPLRATNNDFTLSLPPSNSASLVSQNSTAASGDINDEKNRETENVLEQSVPTYLLFTAIGAAVVALWLFVQLLRFDKSSLNASDTFNVNPNVTYT